MKCKKNTMFILCSIIVFDICLVCASVMFSRFLDLQYNTIYFDNESCYFEEDPAPGSAYIDGCAAGSTDHSED